MCNPIDYGTGIVVLNEQLKRAQKAKKYSLMLFYPYDRKLSLVTFEMIIDRFRRVKQWVVHAIILI